MKFNVPVSKAIKPKGKKFYGVTYTLPNGERDGEDFKRKSDAIKSCRELLKKGCTKVFLDTYDNEEDRNLIDYKQF